MKLTIKRRNDSLFCDVLLDDVSIDGVTMHEKINNDLISQAVDLLVDALAESYNEDAFFTLFLNLKI